MDTLTKPQIGRLRATQQPISRLRQSAASDQDGRPGPKGWSGRFVACHLDTVEEECYQDRLARIASAERPPFKSCLNTGRGFAKLDLADSHRAWAHIRREIIEFVSHPSRETRALSGVHEASGTLAVRLTRSGPLQLMFDHDQEHLEDLRKMIHQYRSKPVEIQGKRVSLGPMACEENS